MNTCMTLSIAHVVGATIAHLSASPGMVFYCTVMAAALVLGSILTDSFERGVNDQPD